MKINTDNVDRAIESACDDLLERSDFSQSIARVIESWKGHDSLVIGLSGKWGSGKTSIKNMVTEQFKDKTVLFEFNSWFWSGNSKLLEVFFNDLSTAMGKKNSPKKLQHLSKLLKTYSSFIKLGGHLSSAIPPTYLIAGVFLGIYGLENFQTNRVSAFTAIIVAGLAFIAKLMEHLSNSFESLSKLQSKPLEDKKDDVTKAFRNLDKPVVIVIDDIDRLTDNEILTIFQLVKCNADFPNTVYLLLFDKERVTKSLSKNFGNGYLDKIIHLPFDVPSIERAKVENVFTQGLEKILSNEDINQYFDKDRWHRIFTYGITTYIRSLRDAKRVLLSLEFHANVFNKSRTIDVNPIDLIGLEILRIFEPSGYKAISTAKTLLTGHSTSIAFREIAKDAPARNITEWIKTNFSEEKYEAASNILANIFPWVSTQTGNYYGDSETDISTHYINIRACHPEIFERYFQLNIPTDQISQSDVNKIIKSTANHTTFIELFSSYNTINKRDTFLKTLNAYKEKIPQEHARDFIAGLMSIVDNLPRGFLVQFDPQASVHNTAYWYLLQNKTLEERFSAVSEASALSDGTHLLNFLTYQNSRLSNNDPTKPKLFSDDHAKHLIELFKEKMISLLSTNPEYFFKKLSAKSDLIHLSQLEAEEKYKPHIISFSKTNLSEVLNALKTDVQSTGGDYSYLDYKITSKFLDIEELKRILPSMVRNSNNAVDIELFRLADEMFDRHDKGLPDDDF